MPQQSRSLALPAPRGPLTRRQVSALAGLAVGVLVPLALRATTTTTGLAWETPLQTIKDSLTGPVAFAISLIALVAGGIALVWGGEMNEFARRIVMIVMVVAFIAGASSIYTTLFGAGAVLTGFAR